MSNKFAYNDGCVIVEVDGFIEFYVHWYWSYSIKRATKLKLRDRRTLPASLISYVGTILSLLWPNKCALIFCRLQREQTKSLSIQNNGKTLCSTLPRTVKGPQPQKGRKAKSTVSAHWDKHFLRDALSSVSEQAVKGAKNFASRTLLNCSVEQRGVRNSTLPE